MSLADDIWAWSLVSMIAISGDHSHHLYSQVVLNLVECTRGGEAVDSVHGELLLPARYYAF